MDLFDSVRTENAPLSDRMRARDLDEFLGQEHIINKNSLLQRAIYADKLGSTIFYGPPGTGKTTLASIIAKKTKANYVYLNAVSSGVQDAKKVIEDAKNLLSMYGKKTYLLLDECHRWSKAQSDSVLSAIEKGEIVFIGSTTENPYVSMTRAIVSRCRVFEFKRLSAKDLVKGLERAIADKERGLGNYDISLEPQVLEDFAYFAGGDLRNALNALELAVLSTPPNEKGVIFLTRSVVAETSQRKVMSVDDGLYYDLLSAFCKSLRGSDPDAALYYSMRLIDAGCDPMLILRRLIVHSAEDVGIADPNALTIAVAAMTAFEKIGLPEGKIPLAEAIIYVCLAPKSNSVINALNLSEEAAARAEDESVPSYLKDQSFVPKEKKDNTYKYPHDYGGYVEQNYMPLAIKDRRFYIPTKNGKEKDVIIPKDTYKK